MDLAAQTRTGAEPATSLQEALAIAGLEAVHGADIPLFNDAAVAAALVERSGRVVCASPAFLAFVNTLDFRVVDVGVVTALRVDDLVGVAEPAQAGVPEPSAWTLMIIGFGTAGAVMRRRRMALPV